MNLDFKYMDSDTAKQLGISIQSSELEKIEKIDNIDSKSDDFIKKDKEELKKETLRELGLLILELKSRLPLNKSGLTQKERYKRLKDYYEKRNINEEQMLDIVKEVKFK